MSVVTLQEETSIIGMVHSGALPTFVSWKVCWHTSRDRTCRFAYPVRKIVLVPSKLFFLAWCPEIMPSCTITKTSPRNFLGSTSCSVFLPEPLTHLRYGSTYFKKCQYGAFSLFLWSFRFRCALWLCLLYKNDRVIAVFSFTIDLPWSYYSLALIAAQFESYWACACNYLFAEAANIYKNAYSLFWGVPLVSRVILTGTPQKLRDLSGPQTSVWNLLTLTNGCSHR